MNANSSIIISTFTFKFNARIYIMRVLRSRDQGKGTKNKTWCEKITSLDDLTNSQAFHQLKPRESETIAAHKLNLELYN